MLYNFGLNRLLKKHVVQFWPEQAFKKPIVQFWPAQAFKKHVVQFWPEQAFKKPEQACKKHIQAKNVQHVF